VITKEAEKIIKKNVDYYTYRVTWSGEDNEFVGLCAEFPSLSWLAHTKEEALCGISNLIKELISDMVSNHEVIPEPIAIKHFSGKFTTRVPPEVHRNLTIQAAEANISFNRLVSFKLSK
jgi:predicted HicB family RNase H-like nuclease